jgi:S1-C subfamily serine protease
LSTTISKGVVSAYRTGKDLEFIPSDSEARDLKYIQSDAAIHGGSSGGALVDRFGNVVAVSVAGLHDTGAKKLGTSLNFFIPIADALKHLAVEVVGQEVARS